MDWPAHAYPRRRGYRRIREFHLSATAAGIEPFAELERWG